MEVGENLKGGGGLHVITWDRAQITRLLESKQLIDKFLWWIEAIFAVYILHIAQAQHDHDAVVLLRHGELSNQIFFCQFVLPFL